MQILHIPCQVIPWYLIQGCVALVNVHVSSSEALARVLVWRCSFFKCQGLARRLGRCSKAQARLCCDNQATPPKQSREQFNSGQSLPVPTPIPFVGRAQGAGDLGKAEDAKQPTLGPVRFLISCQAPTEAKLSLIGN